MYTATEFSTTADKQRFERQFKRFVERGFRREDFPKTFYQRLSNCFGFIAHYNVHGFYETYFTTPEGKVDFLLAVTRTVYGDPAFTFSDVEREVQSWVLVGGFLEQAQQASASAQEAQERAELTRLQAKYA